MTEPTPTGALACPFVAFEDDRDARADVPDHRHRCYAEIRPAPRAIAHQEAFCLSPGFAACPTFQDWARREAARAKPTGRNELAGLARPGRGDDRPARGDGDGDRADEEAGAVSPYARPADARSADVPPGRGRSRDWAAPPAWVAGPAGDPDDADAPPFLSGARESSGSGSGSGSAAGRGGSSAGLAGSEAEAAAAGLAGSRWLNEARSAPADDPELDDLDRSLEADRAARHAREATASHVPAASLDDEDYDEAPVRPVATGVASPGRRANQVSRRPPAVGREGRPAWERSRRNEAYPTLKTRVGMPAIPRGLLALGALVIAAVVIFSLPFLLNLGSSGVPTPSSSVAPADSGLPSSAPTSSVAAGAPSPHVYTVVSGDTITKIAKRFNVTTAALLAANPQIKNANSIKPGDKITIPSAAPSDEVTGASPSAS
ncbi:MAG TPA: LysM peptidoglycan-binding domain-containing protein [Candidatus Limnocylindrales bacterium]|jgi:LysM repeat protein